MTDHHDFADHHFDDDHHDHDPLPLDDDHGYQEPPAWDDDDAGLAHHDIPDLSEAHVRNTRLRTRAVHAEAEPPVEIVDTTADHPGDISEMSDAGDVFPPAVDVGDLPEPVDGWPWIDSGSLGLADIAAALHQADTEVEPVQPHELAEYAATDLPPGVDPWAALADSDDPATSALARWWSEN